MKWITHNWVLKVSALLLAAALWAAVASETSSEIGMDVSLEYRNVPSQLEITGETTNMVEVRLRGSSNLIKGIAPKDVSTAVDLSGMKAGQRVVTLTPQNVEAPFGTEVVRVQPSSIRVNLERTISKAIPVSPTIEGQPDDGFEIESVSVNPSSVFVEGPESRVDALTMIPTAPIHIDGWQSSALQSVDLDLQDTHVRLRNSAAVAVEVAIRPKS